MRKIPSRFFMSFLALCFFGNALMLMAQSSEDFLAKARKADAALLNAEALTLLLQANKLAPNHPEIESLIAKQYSQLAASAGDAGNTKIQKQLSDTALEYAKKAVASDPDNATAHASLAICYARGCLLESPRRKIEESLLVRSEAEKAIALDPNQDVALHVLGAWNYNMVQLNPFLKKLVEIIYGKFPDASLDASVQYFRRAAKSAPTRLMHQAALAKTYAAMGNKEAAQAALAAAMSLPIKEREDAPLLKEAKQAVEKL